MRLLPLLALLACDPETATTKPGAPVDEDADGYADVDTDCDDGRADVYPGAAEVCDGVDQDCDGAIDEGVLSVFFADSDADGFGELATTTERCEPPDGYVQVDTDCDDGRADVYPGAPEVCDGVDQDCDGAIDNGVLVTWYGDLDGDGHGSAGLVIRSCEAPNGYVASSDDCDDQDAEVSPSATEVCNGLDDDCDGLADPDGAPGSQAAFGDRDGDGWGDGPPAMTCALPAGYAAADGDCDDAIPEVHPEADELCNGRDDDCDGDTDEDAIDALWWYADVDADGFGAPSPYDTWACERPVGYADTSTDCDDLDAAISPSALEICDRLDNDCDGVADEPDAAGALTWYRDADGDGYGDPATARPACEVPAGYTDDASDCADGDAAIHPAAAERCDGADDDCDGLTDESDAIDVLTWYLDADRDGWAGTTTTLACTAPPGYLGSSADCDDGDGAVNPGAAEACNGRDDDCDGVSDEGFDADGDSIVDCDEITHTVDWGIAVDDEWAAWVDGVSYASGSGWSTAWWYSLSLDSGPHVLTIQGWDSGAAIAGLLTYVAVDGVTWSLSGDGQWRVYNGTPGGSWADPGYDDSSWGTGIVCESWQVGNWWGGAPASLRDIGANWIWGQDCNALGSVVVRLSFDLP